MSDEARLQATIYVGGLSPEVNSSILHDAFVPFGEITDITIPKPELKSNVDPHRGFGYVEFESADDAKEAMDNMDQSELFGRVLKVTQAKPKKAQNAGLGSRTALWEQASTTRRNELETILNIPRRKATQPNTMLARTTGKLSTAKNHQRHSRRGLTPCKGWRVSMSQDLSPNSTLTDNLLRLSICYG